MIITSPNTVLANCLTDSLDLLRPRLEMSRPSEVIFVVGTQINGVPHIGTYIVQCASFILAQRTRQKFGIPTSVHFGALDNAPYDMATSNSGHQYQRDYGHALDKAELDSLIDLYYTPFFRRLQEISETKFVSETYSDQQRDPQFRLNFLKSLSFAEKIRWCVAPSSGVLRIRIPCPECNYAEKYAERTVLVEHDEKKAVFECICLNHGKYTVIVEPSSKHCEYLDLNTIYRNLVKESICCDNTNKLYVMVKGGDWVFSCQPVDWALGVMGYNPTQIPVRIFTPQIVTETGAKLSKSLIKQHDGSMDQVPEWILDMERFAQRSPDYVEQIVWLVEQFLSHPRHMYRSYSYQEVIRILKLKGATRT
jgi:hypothetical protein